MKLTEKMLGDLVYAILHKVYVEAPLAFKAEADQRQITVEQLAAAAIAGAVFQEGLATEPCRPTKPSRAHGSTAEPRRRVAAISMWKSSATLRALLW